MCFCSDESSPPREKTCDYQGFRVAGCLVMRVATGVSLSFHCVLHSIFLMKSLFSCWLSLGNARWLWMVSNWKFWVTKESWVTRECWVARGKGCKALSYLLSLSNFPASENQKIVINTRLGTVLQSLSLSHRIPKNSVIFESEGWIFVVITFALCWKPWLPRLIIHRSKASRVINGVTEDWNWDIA